VKQPPGPRTLGTLRRLTAARGKRNEFLEGIARQYGDIAYVRAGPTGFYLISHPDLSNDALETHDEHFQRIPGERRYSARVVNDALFASEGSFHARRRALIDPLIYGDVPSVYANDAVEFAARMTAPWQAGQTIDAVDAHERMTTALMIKMLFGEDVAEPRGKAIARALLGAIAASDAIPLAPTRFSDLLPLPSKKRLRGALVELHRLIDQAATDRGADRPDVLSRLASARDRDGRGMTFEQARDEAISLFRGQKRVAGAALSWTWYLLSQHPEAESRFHDEIDSVLGERLPTYDDMPRLPYALMAFREALRLYGPSWVMARKCVASHQAGGYVIPPGATVLISSYVHQRDPRFWSDPTRFVPERFAGGAPTLAGSGYFPQGAGPKRCPGMDLLPVMAVMALATVGRRWRLVLPPGHHVIPRATVFLSPRGGLPVTLEERGRS
jgi:cytochrome P450